MYIRYTWFSDKSFSSFKVKRYNYSLYVLNINTHLMQMTSYRSERKNLSREGERNGVISMQKEICFFQVFIADEVSHVKYATIMLTSNCPWQRPVKRFGTLSLRSRDRSLPIAAFRSTDALPVANQPFFHSRFLDVAKHFRISITFAKTTANDRPRS